MSKKAAVLPRSKESEKALSAGMSVKRSFARESVCGANKSHDILRWTANQSLHKWLPRLIGSLWRNLWKSLHKRVKVNTLLFTLSIPFHIFHSLLSHLFLHRFEESYHRVLLCMWIESAHRLIGVFNIGIESTRS